MMLYIEIFISYIILYDMTTLNIVTRYNGLGIALASSRVWTQNKLNRFLFHLKANGPLRQPSGMVVLPFSFLLVIDF
jgi:hypothetical protein